MADVSVVTLALNARDTIEQALRSVLAQAQVGEVVVVDDGSTDGTADVVRSLDDPRIRLIPGPRAGFTPALNTGLKTARLPFVALCDSDDWWSADRLDWQRGWMEQHPDHIAVSGGFASATHDGQHVADLGVDHPEGDANAALLRGETITSFCTWLTRREALEQAGFARDWFETSSDLDLQFRLAGHGTITHVPRVCYHYRLHEASVTHRQPAPRRVFFEEAARRFARQRAAQGQDDLMAGRPPVFEEGAQTAGATSSPAAQIAGQLVGTAWRQHRAGKRRAAVGTMARALKTTPTSLSVWRNAAVMAVKTLLRR